MRHVIVGFMLLAVMGCGSSPWVWVDTRAPSRDSAEADLAACSSYASSQYRPGIPAGDPYRHTQNVVAASDNSTGPGTWHPDREPFPYTNRSQESIHNVVVPYTGYPGYLDYHPEFLDALVEKCMADRGWAFEPTTGNPK
jgi:hypothetical protein